MSTQTTNLDSLMPDNLTPIQQLIFEDLSRYAGWMEKEKYYLGTHGGNPMTPEVFDNIARWQDSEMARKNPVVQKSREFFIGQYLLSPETELLNNLHRESPIVTLLTGELRRYAERFHGISRYDAKVTGDLVIEYCGRFNLPKLIPLLTERLGL